MLKDQAKQASAVDEFLSRLDKLHSSPTIALRVMEITRDPDFNIETVADCLELDPALSASILRLVNSSYYGLVDEVANPRHALAYLGRRSLRLAVLSFGLVKTLVNGAPAQFHHYYWKRSMTMASAARECASMVTKHDVDPDTAFATGLIADLGMLAMAQLETERYVSISDEPDHTIELPKYERDEFGFDHMAVSRQLMVRWQLPEELIEAVGNHHVYLPVSAPLNHVALVANLIAEVIWTPACPYMQPLQQVLTRQLGLGIDDLISLVVSTKNSIEEASEIFAVQLQDEIDVDMVEQVAREQFRIAAREVAEDPSSIQANIAIPIA